MRTRLIVAFFFILLAGCGQEPPAPVVVTLDTGKAKVTPEIKQKEPPRKAPIIKKPDPVQLVTFDLRPYGIYGVIDAPADPGILQNVLGDLTLTGPDGYAVTLKTGVTDLAKLKNDLLTEQGAKPPLVDDRDALLIELDELGRPRFRFEVNNTLGDVPFRLGQDLLPPITVEQAQRNLRAARSLRQPPELARARRDRDDAETALTKRGVKFETLGDGSRQVSFINLPNLTNADLELLSNFPELSQVVILSDGKLTATGLRVIESLPRLKKLSLQGQWVDAQCLGIVGNNGGLRSLKLAGVPISRASLTAIGKLGDLDELELRQMPLTDAGIDVVAGKKKLKYLRLDNTDVGAGIALLLKELPDLRELSLSDTAITDQSLAGIDALVNLRSLDLSQTLVTDASIDVLSKLPDLSEIDIEGTAITAAGVEKLKNARPTVQLATAWPPEEQDPQPVLPPVPTADLKPGDPAALVTKLGGKLTRNEEILGKPIVTIDLSNTKVTDREAAELRDLPHLRELNLENCEAITQAGLPYFAGLKDLEILNLRGTRVYGDGLVHLGKLTKLRQLLLPPTLRLSGKQLEPIAGLPDIEVVNFMIPIVDFPVLAQIAKMTKLKELSLDSAMLSDRKLAFIKGLKNLELLSLGRLGNYSDRGLDNLRDMTELKALMLHRYAGGGAGLTMLRNFTKLEEFQIDGPGVTDSALAPLAALSELKRLRLDNVPIGDSTLQHVRNLDKLFEIRLHGTRISDRGMEIIGSMKGLELIDVAYTLITDAGVAKLKDLEELRALRLDGTSVNGEGLKALEGLPRLYRLSLFDTKVSDSALPIIARIAPLLSLDIGRTAVTAEGLPALKMLPNLSELHLVDCKLIKNEAIAVIRGLRSLKSISVRGSGLTGSAVGDLQRNGLIVDITDSLRKN